MAPLQKRNYIIMEMRSNLIKDSCDSLAVEGIQRGGEGEVEREGISFGFNWYLWSSSRHGTALSWAKTRPSLQCVQTVFGSFLDRLGDDVNGDRSDR